jgi:SAM-dependent methyltransferase
MLKSESVDGSKKNTVYQCTPETSLYLDRGKQTYMGGTLDMLSRRSYRFWADLREALETGVMQNEAKQTGWQIWDDLYYNPPQLTKLMESYIGLGHTNFRLLAQKFDFHKYQTLLDVGGATGQLAAYVALEHRHLTAVSTDREQVQPIAEKWLRRWGVEDRVCFKADGMFSVNPFPSADVITMSAILRQWNPTDQLQLIEKAHQALPSHGALIVLEDMIDDDRRSCTHGLCHSLDLLIELGCEGGYNLTQGDLRRLMKEAGFVRTQHMPLTGMTSAMIAYKQ